MRKLVLWSCCAVSKTLENVSERKLLRKLWIFSQEIKRNFEHSSFLTGGHRRRGNLVVKGRCFVLAYRKMARNWTAVDVSVVMGRKPMASPLKRQTGKVHLPMGSWLVIWNMKFNFPIILGISSSQLTFTPWFFRGVGWNHQPVSIVPIPNLMFFLVTTRNQFALPQGILSVDFPRIFKGDATVWQRIDSAGKNP